MQRVISFYRKTTVTRIILLQGLTFRKIKRTIHNFVSVLVLFTAALCYEKKKIFLLKKKKKDRAYSCTFLDLCTYLKLTEDINFIECYITSILQMMHFRCVNREEKSLYHLLIHVCQTLRFLLLFLA